MKKTYIYPVILMVAVENVCLLNGSPVPQSSDANPLYPALSRDEVALDWLDE